MLVLGFGSREPVVFFFLDITDKGSLTMVRYRRWLGLQLDTEATPSG